MVHCLEINSCGPLPHHLVRLACNDIDFGKTLNATGYISLEEDPHPAARPVVVPEVKPVVTPATPVVVLATPVVTEACSGCSFGETYRF